MGTHQHGRQKCKFGQDLRFPLQLFLAPPLRHRLRRRAVKLQSLRAAHTLRLSFRAPPRFPIRTVRKPPAAVTLATINMSTTDERRATSFSSASAKASSRCRISWPRFSASSVIVRISLCPLSGQSGHQPFVSSNHLRRCDSDISGVGRQRAGCTIAFIGTPIAVSLTYCPPLRQPVRW
jgi:hypothetical protein